MPALGNALALVFLLAAGAACRASDDPVECPGCRIRLERVAVLGADGGPGLTPRTRVVWDGRGRYFAAPTYDPGKVAVYDAGGRFVRAFGRQGGGPGEFREIHGLAVAPGDSLYVVDRGGRVGVLGPAQEPARGVTLPDRPHDLLVAPPYLVLAPWGLENPSAPVQWTDAAGRPVRAAAEPDPQSRIRTSAWELAPAPGGAVWTARIDGEGYRLALYGADARPRREHALAPAWLRERASLASWVGRLRSSRRQVPPGRIADFAVADGRGWVVLMRENEDWAERARKTAARGGREAGVVRLDAEDVRARYDRRVEVVDLATGRLVARARLPQLARGFADAHHLVSHRETEGGAVVVDVWRASLERS
jgi:hypothetical protein